MNPYIIHTTIDTLYETVIEIYDHVIYDSIQLFHIIVDKVTSEDLSKFTIFIDLLNDLSSDLKFETKIEIAND